MNAEQRLSAIGGGEPVKAVAVGYPLHELAGGHKRGVDRHGQGEAGQGRYGNTKRNPVY